MGGVYENDLVSNVQSFLLHIENNSPDQQFCFMDGEERDVYHEGPQRQNDNLALSSSGKFASCSVFFPHHVAEKTRTPMWRLHISVCISSCLYGGSWAVLQHISHSPRRELCQRSKGTTHGSGCREATVSAHPQGPRARKGFSSSRRSERTEKRPSAHSFPTIKQISSLSH